MLAYRIVGWKQRYEVGDNSKVSPAGKPMEKLRKSPLNYVRLKVYGHKLGPAFRRMTKLAWGFGEAMPPAAFGVFCKLLELAADQQREYRGWILDEKQQPMQVSQIAELIGWTDVAIIKKSLEILTDETIGWVELKEFSQIPPAAGERGGDKGKEGDACGGKEGKLQDETETESPTENLTESKLQPDSLFQKPHDSASDSATIKHSQVFIGKLMLEFPRQNHSDRTTFMNLANHLAGMVDEKPKVFNEALALVGLCRDRDNPRAYFVGLCKEKFGFRKTVVWHSNAKKRRKKLQQVRSQYQ